MLRPDGGDERFDGLEVGPAFGLELGELFGVFHLPVDELFKLCLFLEVGAGRDPEQICREQTVESLSEAAAELLGGIGLGEDGDPEVPLRDCGCRVESSFTAEAADDICPVEQPVALGCGDCRQGRAHAAGLDVAEKTGHAARTRAVQPLAQEFESIEVPKEDRVSAFEGSGHQHTETEKQSFTLLFELGFDDRLRDLLLEVSRGGRPGGIRGLLGLVDDVLVDEVLEPEPEHDAVHGLDKTRKSAPDQVPGLSERYCSRGGHVCPSVEGFGLKDYVI